MNPHILFVIDHQMNPEKHTKEQLMDNYKTAYKDYVSAAYKNYASAAPASAASYTSYAAYAVYSADDITYWINEYLKRSGENKQDYIDEINKESQS